MTVEPITLQPATQRLMIWPPSTLSHVQPGPMIGLLDPDVLAQVEHLAAQLARSQVLPWAWRLSEDEATVRANLFTALLLALQLGIGPVETLWYIVPIRGKLAWTSAFLRDRMQRVHGSRIEWATHTLGTRLAYAGTVPDGRGGEVEVSGELPGVEVEAFVEVGGRRFSRRVSARAAVEQRWVLRNLRYRLGDEAAISMLEERASGQLISKYFPELRLGLPVASELEDEGPEQGADVLGVQAAATTGAPDDGKSELDAALGPEGS